MRQSSRGEAPRSTSSRIVGIDLGTSHTVVAVEEGGGVAIMPVLQRVSATEEAARELLPSCLYAPLDGEGLGEGWLVGEHARRRGAEVAGRAISSAKSWLAHAAVDRAAAILPWGLEQSDVGKLSPLGASARILEHVQGAYDRRFGRPLAAEQVVLTVPASFDAVARELTVAAARAAGLSVRLCEEPQAALYEALGRAPEEVERAAMGDGDEGAVLVVDVGGGTTDLSLIRVRRRAGALDLRRLAVGRHLLLGGDNIDLALAHRCEAEMGRLDERGFAQLALACRSAKEALLGDGAPARFEVALAGSGSKLVGATRRARLMRDEVRSLVLDGFFPEVPLGPAGPRPPRAGVVAFGLPYEREVAITRHVADFVHRHGVMPTALLLNGGVFASPLLCERMRAVVQGWGAEVRGVTVSPHLAVARGAVAYGLALAGRGPRIAGGTARGFYVRLGDGVEAMCVLPRGTEDEDVQRAGRTLALTVGKAARFELYAADSSDAVGQLVTLDPEIHQPLAPLVATVAARPGERPRREVTLEARLTAVGTVELCCVGDGERHILGFELHPAEASKPVARHGKRLAEASAAIQRVYGKSAQGVPEREVKALVRELERLLGQPRRAWDAQLCRALFDVLALHVKRRRRSPEHERVFWLLAGFCLRPGRGFARDAERVAKLAPLFGERLAHAKELKGWQMFWIAWRRLAAGLDEATQLAIRDAVDPLLAPPEARRPVIKAYRNDARFEMLDLCASLERVPSARRVELGGWVLERTWVERDARLWRALGMIGARVPAYGSAHNVVPAAVVERWVDHLVREKWDGIATAPAAAIAMCRLTGDRARDVSDAARAQIDQRLRKLGLDEELRRPLNELSPLDGGGHGDFYGEELPAGLDLG